MNSQGPAHAKDIDESSVLVEKQILHRQLQDGSGLDYFIYRPSRDATPGPLFVAVHDISRNARAQATAFAAVCDGYGATLVAPHFAVNRYPNYQRLGRSRYALDRGKRADEALDEILEEVATLVEGLLDRYTCLATEPAAALRCGMPWRTRSVWQAS